MQSGIYLITNLENGKIYIGRSKNISSRLKQHKRDLIGNRHSNPYLQTSWNKYGEENFIFEPLEFLPINYTYSREIYWIKAYNSLDRLSGYNVEEPDIEIEKFRDKSKANLKNKPPVSTETKARISQTLMGHEVKPEWKDKMSKTWFKKGKKFSKEFITKMVEGQSKIYQFKSPTDEVITIKNLSQFCRDNQLCVTSMRKIYAGNYYSYTHYKGWSKI